MKFISSHNPEIKDEIKEQSYNMRGFAISGEDEKIFSKTLGNKYLIRTFNNVPLDPFGPEAGRQIWDRTQLKTVSKTTFDNYNKYLETRNRLYLTRANRSYING